MTLVDLIQEAGVAIVTLADAPRRNALSTALLQELAARLGDVAASDAGAVVLTGAGGTFSAGADLRELTGTAADVRIDDAVSAVSAAIAACPLPVVAAVEGPCVGAAVDLALACDVRIVARDGFFAVPAVALGILYNPAALERMARTVPTQTLARLLLFGERIGGQDAVTAGLAAQAVEAGAALEAAVALAGGAVRGVPDARAATKRALCALAAEGLAADHWSTVRRALLDGPERTVAVQAARRRLAIDQDDRPEAAHAHH